MKRLAKKNRIRLILSAVMVACGAGITGACRSSEAVADWYTGGPFQLFPNVVGRLTGLLPFSLYEVMLYLLAAGMVWRIFRGLSGLLLRRRDQDCGLASEGDEVEAAPRRKGGIQNAVCGLACFLSLVFCVASFTCLANYGRSPLAGQIGLVTQPSSVEELRELCQGLADDAAAVMDQVQRDREHQFSVDGIDVQQEARKAMYRLGEQYDVFEGYYPLPKPVLWSEGMSYIDLTGMYSPFTIEANYNAAATDYLIPYTICHELAHLRGFIREDEAGFIAWLACDQSDDPHLQYSGAVSALRYALNALYREVDYEEYAEFYNALPLEIRWDLWKNSQYWQRHQTFTYQVGTKVNDVYLKVNSQEGGVKSYGRMVDLLLAYRRAGAELT
ncbi:MAG: DUF3810 domain-containing protein [Firmicutes bacterium]|nr:DUF3810 domain-containing protein [Bacillota bacterium]